MRKAFAILVVALAARAGAQAPTLSALTTSFIAPVRSAVRLRTWRRTHPGDSVLRSWEGDGYVQCASVHSRVPIAGGDTAEVRVLFYVPALPVSRELPVNETPDQVLDRCQAGMAWITVRDTVAARITAVHRALQEYLATAHLLGDAVLPWMRKGAASVDGLSRHDDSVFVGSVRFMETRRDGVIFPCCELMVRVAARRTHETTEIPEWERASAAEEERSRELDRQMGGEPPLAMLSEAAIGGPLERDVRVAFKRLADSGMSTNAMIDLLQRWLASTKALHGARRAAGLLVADSLMRSWIFFFDYDVSGDVFHDRLAAIGVPLVLRQGDKGDWYYLYRRDWPMQAYTIAPTSRAGESAFLNVIATEGECASDHTALVARSEEYLRRYPHSRIDGQLHAWLGEEWAGEVIVYTTVPQEGPSSLPDSVRHQRADAARQKAIAHFQSAFRLNVDPEITWNDAFMVLAGLPQRRDVAVCE